MEEQKETKQDDQNTLENQPNSQPTTLSINAKKKLVKQQKWEAKKAEKKAQMKEQKKKEGERKRKEWEEKLSSCASEEERLKLIESRRELRKERMGKRAEEKEEKTQRLRKAKEFGQNIVIDLEFADLMTNSEIHSLVQQARVWAVQLALLENNCVVGEDHLLLCCEWKMCIPWSPLVDWVQGEMENQLQRLPGFDKWIIEKESQSYIEALQDQKENLVYLTADSETVLDELDLKKIYIVGGLVDRNRWKGLTMNKANEQGIQTAKLPISSYLKMSSSQVLTVNQVVEILLKFVETKDWKASFFQVIPQRKRGETDPEEHEGVDREELEVENEPSEKKRQSV